MIILNPQITNKSPNIFKETSSEFYFGEIFFSPKKGKRLRGEELARMP